MQVKDVASTLVLGLLFFSLVAIYLVTSQNILVTGLSILIIALCLIIVRIGDWREIGIVGTLAAIVSVVAANVVGQARFGDVGGVLLAVVWAFVLLGIFAWISGNIQRIPSDRAIISVRTYTGQLVNPSAPLATPMLPFLERKIATIPLYELSSDVTVKNVNTAKQHNISAVNVHVGYKVANREKAPLALAGIPNRGLVQTDIAKELGKDIDDARTDIIFWEKLLDKQMQLEVDDVVRAVVFQTVEDPAKGYREREQLGLAERIRERLDELVRRWGVEITRLEIDSMDVDRDRFKTSEGETNMEKAKAEREANRIRLVRQAEAAAEADRVRQLVIALKEAKVDVSPALLEDIVISAIQASTDWGLDVRYDPLLDDPTRRAGSDKKEAPKK
jgi:hypothetical protein